jgi:hypothetical protein
MHSKELPLQIGETVMYNAYASGLGVSGVIVERIGEDCLRVKWQDVSVPTTHRSHSLRREVKAPTPIHMSGRGARARN